MAINLSESRFDKTREAALDPSHTGALERGMVMVYSGAAADGSQMVKPSEGSSTEVVAGLLWLSETVQESVPYLEDLTIPATSPYQLTLKFLPINKDDLIIIDASGTEVTVVDGSSPSSGEIGLGVGTKLLTAHSGLANAQIRVIYRYAISAQLLARRGGRRSVNQGAERVHNQVTLKYGNMRVLTSCFDVDVQYTADPSDSDNILHTEAGGLLTVAAAANAAVGTCFQTPVLKLTPGIEQAFIGLECNIP